MVFNYDVSDLISAIGDIKFSDVNIVQTANTDLDDYTTSGIYQFTGTYTPLNIPSGSNGWLFVMANSNESGVKQLWFRQGVSDSTDHYTYVRTLASGIWSTWKKFITSADYAYQSGDTFVLETDTTFGGLISSSSEKVLFSAAVDKSLKNISTITVTALSGRIRSIAGYLDTSSVINFTSGDYSASADIRSNRLLEITITKSSDFVISGTTTVIDNNTPVMFHGTMTLTFS